MRMPALAAAESPAFLAQDVRAAMMPGPPCTVSGVALYGLAGREAVAAWHACARTAVAVGEAAV